jgi:hypothetical protein
LYFIDDEKAELQAHSTKNMQPCCLHSPHPQPNN